jgi:predicted AAA+ superfamily ATPase
MKPRKKQTGKGKDIVDVIHTPKDEESQMRRQAKKSVIENNLKEKKFKNHKIYDKLHGYRIVFDRDKQGNLIPVKN